MQVHAPAYPGIHLDEALGLYALDVYRLAAIENRQVSGLAAIFHQMAHDWERNFAHIQFSQRAMPQAEQLKAYLVLAGLDVATQVPAILERAQNVTGGTLGNFQLAADLTIGHPSLAGRDLVQNTQCPVNAYGWAFTFHGQGY